MISNAIVRVMEMKIEAAKRRLNKLYMKGLYRTPKFDFIKLYNEAEKETIWNIKNLSADSLRSIILSNCDNDMICGGIRGWGKTISMANFINELNNIEFYSKKKLLKIITSIIKQIDNELKREEEKEQYERTIGPTMSAKIYEAESRGADVKYILLGHCEVEYLKKMCNYNRTAGIREACTGESVTKVPGGDYLQYNGFTEMSFKGKRIIQVETYRFIGVCI